MASGRQTDGLTPRETRASGCKFFDRERLRTQITTNITERIVVLGSTRQNWSQIGFTIMKIRVYRVCFVNCFVPVDEVR
ncbi:hypothetical protein LC1Hm_0069 [Halomicrobium sp. LC1Hm]|nr:hypothetical protein LC1Hm_0069 [Halomicrobium sp. LC1Hm]